MFPLFHFQVISWLSGGCPRHIVDKLVNVFAGIYEFSVLSAFCPLQHTANELAGPTTAAAAAATSAGPELPKSENPLQWLRDSRE